MPYVELGLFALGISGSEDKTIKLWDVASGEKLRTLTGHSDSVRSVAFSAEGKYLATGSDDHTAKLWEIASGRELRTFQGHSGFAFSVALSSEGKIFSTNPFPFIFIPRWSGRFIWPARLLFAVWQNQTAPAVERRFSFAKTLPNLQLVARDLLPT